MAGSKGKVNNNGTGKVGRPKKDILDIDVPVPDKDKMDKLKEAKANSRRIERVEMPKIKGKIDSLDRLIPEARAELSILEDKANVIPEVYQDRYNDKLKEVEELESLKKAEEVNLRELDKQVLSTVALDPLEDEVYRPYFIELLNHFSQVLEASNKDTTNNPERLQLYNDRLNHIFQLFIRPGRLNMYYVKVLGNNINHKGRSFYKFNPEEVNSK